MEDVSFKHFGSDPQTLTDQSDQTDMFPSFGAEDADHGDILDPDFEIQLRVCLWNWGWMLHDDSTGFDEV